MKVAKDACIWSEAMLQRSIIMNNSEATAGRARARLNTALISYIFGIVEEGAMSSRSF